MDPRQLPDDENVAFQPNQPTDPFTPMPVEPAVPAPTPEPITGNWGNGVPESAPQSSSVPFPSQPQPTSQPLSPMAPAAASPQFAPGHFMNSQPQPAAQPWPTQPDLRAAPGLQMPQPRDAPQKYKVFRAIADTLAAFGANPVGIVTSLVVGILLAVALAFVVGLLFAATLGNLATSGSKSSILAALIAGGLLYACASAAVTGIFEATLMLAFNDGANGKKSVPTVLVSAGLSKAPRVIMSTLLVYLRIFIPIIILTSIFVAFVVTNDAFSGLSGLALGLAFMFFIQIAGLIWALIVLIRYGLAPLVAVFEPDVPITQTLRRSKHLLKKGGQWFLLKGLLLSMLILLVVGAVSGVPATQLGRANNNIGINIVLIVLSTLISGAAVMLYRNRVSVRG